MSAKGREFRGECEDSRVSDSIIHTPRRWIASCSGKQGTECFCGIVEAESADDEATTGLVCV